MQFSLLLKRGSTTVVSQHTGMHGELVYDKTLGTLRVHDGEKVGGFLLQTEGSFGYRPRIVSPSDFSYSPTVDVAVSFTPYEGAGTSSKVQVQVSTHEDFVDNVYDSGWVIDTGTVTVPLSGGESFFIKVRQRSSEGSTTPWSLPIRVTTGLGHYTFYTSIRQTSNETEYSRTTFIYVGGSETRQTNYAGLTAYETTMVTGVYTSA